MARTKRRLTQAEFDAIKPFLTTINENRQKAAEMYLVHGHTYQQAAEPFNWTRQAVFDSVNKVWEKHQEYKAAQTIESRATSGILLPPGWERVTLIAPSSLIASFREKIAEASNADTSQKKTRTKTKK